MREVLGGGSGGRYYADGEDTIHVVPDSRNLPTSSPSRGSRSSSNGLGWPWIRAVRGVPGGLGYEKHIRMLRDGYFMSIADRSILRCWGVNGGRAGRPFEVTIDPGGPHERTVGALTDAEPVGAGEVIRIRTTGGGGWGIRCAGHRRPSSAMCSTARSRSVARGRTTASSSSTAPSTCSPRKASAPRCARAGPLVRLSSTAARATQRCRAAGRTVTWTGSTDLREADPMPRARATPRRPRRPHATA